MQRAFVRQYVIVTSYFGRYDWIMWKILVLFTHITVAEPSHSSTPYFLHLNMSDFSFNDYYDPEEAYYGYDNDEWHDDDNWYSNDGPEDVLGGDIYQNKNYSHGRLHRVGGQYAV